MRPLAVPVDETDHAQGPREAPVILAEYGDYECSFCGRFDTVIKAVQPALGGALRYVYRHFPLTHLHPHAEHAAAVAEAAGSVGLFWPMHDRLYANQDALDDGSLLFFGKQMGLDEGLIRAAFGGAFADRIRRDVVSGEQSGVRSTPTLFINGQPYEGSREPEALMAALQEAQEGRGRA